MDTIAKTKEAHRRKFAKIFNEVKNSFSLLSQYCMGCQILKTEGAHSYSELAPLVNDKCSVCYKVRYSQLPSAQG